jgi:hypothetical protein
LPIVAGILLAGAPVAWVIGLALIPYSLIGLLLLIGALGFTPWFTGFVCWRCGVRALRAAQFRKPPARRRARARWAFLAAMTTLALPLGVRFAQTEIRERQIAIVQSAEPNELADCLRFLKTWGWALAPEQLLDEPRTASSRRGRAIERAYLHMTGKSRTWFRD